MPAESGLQWMAVDLDDLPMPPDVAPLDDPERAVNAIIEKYLPACFQNVSYHYQWSNSAGIHGWDKVRLHLWYWMDRPIQDKNLHAWAKKLNSNYPHAKKLIDPAVYVSTQPHYTASPILEGFDTDPCPMRSGLVWRKSGMLSIPEAEVIDPFLSLPKPKAKDLKLYQQRGPEW